MRLSPFNSLQFFNSEEYSGQIFAPSDHIRLELFHAPSEKIPQIQLCHDDYVMSLDWQQFPINEGITVSLYELRGLECGSYVLKIDNLTASFEITDDKDILDNTVLIQYAMSDNRQRRDIYCNIAGGIHYFDFRVAGGFLDKDWLFCVEGEQFETDRSDLVSLVSREYTSKMLTLGECDGLPIWVFEKLNTIFTCDLTFVDGKRYTRTDESFEKTATDVKGERFVFLLSLRDAPFVSTEFETWVRLYLRRTPDSLRKVTGNKLRSYKK